VQFLFVLALSLFLGLLLARWADHIHWPPALFLWILGALLGSWADLTLPSSVWFLLAILTVSLAVFDVCSRLDVSRWRGSFVWALLLVGFFAWAVLAHFTFSFKALGFVLLLVCLLLGSDFSRNVPKGVGRFLSEEALSLSALSLVGSFVLLGFLERTMVPVWLAGFVVPLHPFIHDMMVGLGVGLLVGIIFLKWLREGLALPFSPILLWVCVLGSFILAEILSGSGVLAVATLGILFGHGFVKGRTELQEFTRSFSGALEVLVLVLSGMVLKISFSGRFLGACLILFAALLLARFLTVHRMNLSPREREVAVAFMPKGFYSGAALLGLAVLGPGALLPWLQVAWGVMLLCLILSTGVWQDLTQGKLF